MLQPGEKVITKLIMYQLLVSLKLTRLMIEGTREFYVPLYTLVYFIVLLEGVIRTKDKGGPMHEASTITRSKQKIAFLLERILLPPSQIVCLFWRIQFF